MSDQVDNKKFPFMNKNGLPFVMTNVKSEIGDNEGKEDGLSAVKSGLNMVNDCRSEIVQYDNKHSPANKLKLNESIYKIFYAKRDRKDDYGHMPVASSMVIEIKNKNFEPLHDANKNDSNSQRPPAMTTQPTIPILINSPLTQKDFPLSGTGTPKPHRADHRHHAPYHTKEPPHNWPQTNKEPSLPKANPRSRKESPNSNPKFLSGKTMAKIPRRKPPTLSESLKKGHVICVETPFAKESIPVSPSPNKKKDVSKKDSKASPMSTGSIPRTSATY